jgi:hypothetical protein
MVIVDQPALSAARATLDWHPLPAQRA